MAQSSSETSERVLEVVCLVAAIAFISCALTAGLGFDFALRHAFVRLFGPELPVAPALCVFFLSIGSTLESRSLRAFSWICGGLSAFLSAALIASVLTESYFGLEVLLSTEHGERVQNANLLSGVIFSLLTVSYTLFVTRTRETLIISLAGGCAFLAGIVSVGELMAYALRVRSEFGLSMLGATPLVTILFALLMSVLFTVKLFNLVRQREDITYVWYSGATYIAGFSLSLLLWWGTSSYEHKQLVESITRSARLRTTVLQSVMNSNLQALESVERFYSGSSFVSESEFHTFTRHLVAGQSSILGIDWTPRVLASERAAVEREIESAHGERFKRLDQERALIDHPGAELYFPVRYTEPSTAWKEAFGFDHYTDELRRVAMDAAIRTGQVQSTRSFRLFRVENEGSAAEDFLVIVPVWKDSESPVAGVRNPEQLNGFIIGIFRFRAIADDAFRDFPVGSPSLEIFDDSVSANVPILSYLAPRDRGITIPALTKREQEVRVTELLDVAGRAFRLVFTPSSAFLSNRESGLALIVFLISIGLTLVSATYLHVLRRRRVKLLESEARFRSSFIYAGHGIALVGLTGSFLQVNDACTGITGYSASELLSKTFQDITHPEDLEKDLELLRELVANKRQSYRMEKRYYRKDGTIVWVHLNVSIVRHSDGSPLYFVAHIEDISVRKETEFALAQKTHLLEAEKLKAETATQAKGQFLANMSHEIRTPLTAILGFSEQLLDEHLQESEREEFTRIVQTNARHLLELVNDILDFSKIESGKLTVSSEKCGVLDFVRFVDSSLRGRAEEKKLTFVTEVEHTIPVYVKTDSLRLKQILLNLVGNAIKFTQAGSVKVVVSYEAATQHLLFKIVDSGIGLSEEHITRLFQLFSQADSSTTKKFGGTGLGLAISKRLAILLGGDITVTSAIGQGSTFTVRLPAESPEKESSLLRFSPSATSPVKRIAQPVRGTVLVAEDGIANQKLVRRLLENRGLTVKVVENGALAVESALSESFDLVLMDMQMPVLDGYAATQQLLAAGYKVPIVACTADASQENAARLRGIGCSDVIFKPFSSPDLQQLLEKYLASQPG